MTGEMLDGGFRLFRAGLLRCLPYSGLAVLALELPSLYATFLSIGKGAGADRYAVLGVSLLMGIALIGLLTLRLHAISRGHGPRLRGELRTVLRRWPSQIVATLIALSFPGLLAGVSWMINPVSPNPLLIALEFLLIWPSGLVVATLPAFWCDGLGPFEAVMQSLRVSRRRVWRMAGAILAIGCIVLVFFVLAAMVVALMLKVLGSADLFLIAAIEFIAWLVVGAVGVPLLLAMLIVAYEDLKLREAERRGAGA
jgi:hypothetical protein